MESLWNTTAVASGAQIDGQGVAGDKLSRLMTITKKCRAFPARLRLAAGIYISKPLEGGRTKQRECPAERTTGLQRDLNNRSIDQ